jgi:hypothetical protein
MEIIYEDEYYINNLYENNIINKYLQTMKVSFDLFNDIDSIKLIQKKTRICIWTNTK